jgi:hypothetical protein
MKAETQAKPQQVKKSVLFLKMANLKWSLILQNAR